MKERKTDIMIVNMENKIFRKVCIGEEKLTELRRNISRAQELNQKAPNVEVKIKEGDKVDHFTADDIWVEIVPEELWSKN